MAALEIITGYVALFLLFVVASAISAHVASEAISKIHRKLTEDAKELARIQIGQDIAIYACFFSDDKSTHIAVRELGEHIAEYGYVQMSSVKKRWKEELQKQEDGNV